ncbi:4-oxalocrotonate tautomerase family protein [Stappia sp. BW2]|jgi:4-oxalocrotonate tautomerase|uniref:tautomerase family protein n=1 Tax=Stappia sp. BW2 TaxID=2592622 RepID=UPI0011DEB5C7|nr:4-oxalocrotonate tautomerase family protein [Stappia sp. BW2]TYC69990.1 4-oxalocrotonate tautomerase family protein [Stappia sp. BW2]
MPFANYKLPEAALSTAQKEELIHKTTDLLVSFFGEIVRPNTMVLVEEIKDGGYGRADEVFTIPPEYRAGD